MLSMAKRNNRSFGLWCLCAVPPTLDSEDSTDFPVYVHGMEEEEGWEKIEEEEKEDTPILFKSLLFKFSAKCCQI